MEVIPDAAVSEATGYGEEQSSKLCQESIDTDDADSSVYEEVITKHN